LHQGHLGSHYSVLELIELLLRPQLSSRHLPRFLLRFPDHLFLVFSFPWRWLLGLLLLLLCRSQALLLLLLCRLRGLLLLLLCRLRGLLLLLLCRLRGLLLRGLLLRRLQGLRLADHLLCACSGDQCHPSLPRRWHRRLGFARLLCLLGHGPDFLDASFRHHGFNNHLSSRYAPFGLQSHPRASHITIHTSFTVSI
jgi:hypothetical protein